MEGFKVTSVDQVRRAAMIELWKEIDRLELQLADRDAEIRENEGVIRVWRRRDEESRAEIERLNTAFDRVQRASEFVVAEDGRRIYDLTVEIERLRADLVWAANACCDLFAGELWWLLPNGGHGGKIPCDGTPDSICRAVREARDGS